MKMMIKLKNFEMLVRKLFVCSLIVQHRHELRNERLENIFV